MTLRLPHRICLRYSARPVPLLLGRSRESCPPPRISLAAATILTRNISGLPKHAIFNALAQHDPHSKAVIHSDTASSFTYYRLLGDVFATANALAITANRDVAGERIALMIGGGYDYIVGLLSIIASDAIAVPLSPSLPDTELRYVLDHSQASVLLYSESLRSKAVTVVEKGLKSPPILADIGELKDHRDAFSSDDVTRLVDLPQSTRGGLMLYTSGTTSRPKGVLLPTQALDAQCESLQQAWAYTSADHLLHVLPIHHIHGVVNAILTPLLSGSTIEFQHAFNPAAVWNRLAGPFLPRPDPILPGPGPKLFSPAPTLDPITFFTAVPTIYSSLLRAHPSLPKETKSALRKALSPSSLRLNISGSAPLPTPTKTAWTALTSGNVLLERYGMTETGMTLSCALPLSARPDASVGWPLPGVSARLYCHDQRRVIPESELARPDGLRQLQGEIQLRGPGIFARYWRDAAATAAAFTDDGWFRTGDVAERRALAPEAARGPAWFVLGRESADIIKVGGEKVSALEVERELLALDGVAEAVVVGRSHESWGQMPVAVVVLADGAAAGATGNRDERRAVLFDLRRRMKGRLARYKMPRDIRIVRSIPRNAMGKVNKKELVKTLFEDDK